MSTNSYPDVTAYTTLDYHGLVAYALTALSVYIYVLTLTSLTSSGQFLFDTASHRKSCCDPEMPFDYFNDTLMKSEAC